MILTYMLLGIGVTLGLGLLIILPLWWRNRKIPNFMPDQSIITKAMDRQFGPKNWRHEHYMRQESS